MERKKPVQEQPPASAEPRIACWDQSSKFVSRVQHMMELARKARKGRPARKAEELEFNRQLGERMEMLRKRAGVQAIGMAHALGISGSQYYWYEVGRDRCPPFRLVKIAQELGVPITKLLPSTKYSAYSLQVQKSLLV
jgi:hypothetical protein